MHGKLFIALLLAVSSLVAGCADSNNEAPAAGSVHPASWINPDLLGAPPFHGSSGGGVDFSECESCHGSDLTGSGDIPGCFDCHFDLLGSRVPPGSGWTHGPDDPHNELIALQDTCNACHEVYRRFGLAPDKCHDCHGPGINHPLGQPWLDSASPQFHGDSDLVCSDCHDLNEKCFECHFGPEGNRVPPGESWEHGVPFHDLLDPVAYSSTCNSCHNLTRSFRNDPGACHDCHAHPIGDSWLNSASAEFHGESDLTCSDCHDLNIKCFECHFGPTGSRSPAGSGWTHAVGAHGALEPQGDACNCCHNLTRSFRNDPSACHDCHGATHPTGASWLRLSGSPETSHVLASIADLPGCLSCHSPTGGISPLCTDCHTASEPNQDPATCDSCHNKPPNGTTFPNRGLGHQAHFLLPSFTGQADCSACHNGAGSDTLVHWYPIPASPADMAILSSAGAYQAKTGGAPTYSSTGTCNNVSCHGGQGTPDWETGTLNVNIDTGDNTDGCRRCHQETVDSDQYNSYFSGRHRLHIVNRGILCTECHDTASLNRVTTPNHFSGLDTTTFEWAPAQTLDSRLQYDTAPTPPTCNPSAGGLTGCHGEKDWKP